VAPWSPPLTGGVSRGTEEGAAAAVAFARAQLGKPYVWAADGPDAFDCSGLTMRAWEAGGVALPHYSVAQFAQAKKIPASQARSGDLVFFGTDPTDAGTIYHVGLYLGGGQMIEAPYTGSWVRESSIERASFFGFARP
jgi:cell wall-associated NlpC family hydrolase